MVAPAVRLHIGAGVDSRVDLCLDLHPWVEPVARR